VPYKANSDLPDPVRHVLPAKAQEIYRKAFNNAFEQYEGDEVISYKVAWSAVKKSYHKDVSGSWQEK